jgi:hypothetical protein
MGVANQTADRMTAIEQTNRDAEALLQREWVRSRDGDVRYQPDPLPARRRVSTKDYLGQYTGSGYEATWKENLEEMQRVLATMQERGASQERIDWQRICIAKHMECKPK